MDDAERLRRELRATRAELVRKRSQHPDEPGKTGDRLPLMPERDEEFLRLALMSIEDLETRVERLERDLDDLENGFDDLERTETE